MKEFTEEQLKAFILGQDWYVSWYKDVCKYSSSSIDAILCSAVREQLVQTVITDAFIWRDTPEGREYWCDVVSNVKSRFIKYLANDKSNNKSVIPLKFKYYYEEKVVAIIDVKDASADVNSEDVIAWLKSCDIKFDKLEFDYKNECYDAIAITKGFKQC